eukprot:TRINITY_DN80608_c0_g1_i1.p1 TRINITY_DN80608_c0_g1~~TRINITY_DN80608_c0_g1_i1.p1  ORF type:complete len:682 (+),score=65.12 TRINITY_DN80608_c0_g1_i1:65-2047(+)
MARPRVVVGKSLHTPSERTRWVPKEVESHSSSTSAEASEKALHNTSAASSDTESTEVGLPSHCQQDEPTGQDMADKMAPAASRAQSPSVCEDDGSTGAPDSSCESASVQADGHRGLSESLSARDSECHTSQNSVLPAPAQLAHASYTGSHVGVVVGPAQPATIPYVHPALRPVPVEPWSGRPVPPLALPPGGNPQIDPTNSAEQCLLEILCSMDGHMQYIRAAQQTLVAALEAESRRLLGPYFKNIVLVGSAALGVDTPGSDIDVVCFTQKHEDTAPPLPAELLWRLDRAFAEFAPDHPLMQPTMLSTELIVDARVPILRVTLGSVAIDVSVNQSLPVEHVRWAQKVGAAPHPAAMSPPVAPLVTVMLRSVKLWLKQRQIPRAKEGCLPTLGWLLLAVHICSSKEIRQMQEVLGMNRPMCALLNALAVFFRTFAAHGGLNGSLWFSPDGSSSEFREVSKDSSDGWQQLAIMDPTSTESQCSNLVPRLTPATQLLVAVELQRASSLMPARPLEFRDVFFGEGRHMVEGAFSPCASDGINVLPAHSDQAFGAIFLFPGTGGSPGSVELAIVDRVRPRPGWSAAFLHRSDNRSELTVRLFDVNQQTGICTMRKRSSTIVCPCNFVTQAKLLNRGVNWWLDPEGQGRYFSMRAYVDGLRLHHQD